MDKHLNEIVRVYEDCLNVDGLGDFVQCADCGELQLIQLGGTACGSCESENLMWYEDKEGNRIDEITNSELEQMGFIVEYV
jgi:RecJ-like exonuclease